MRSPMTLLLVALLVSSCATVSQPQLRVSIDSLAAPAAAEYNTYILLPGNEGVTWDDLQFQEYALYLIRALHAQGFE